MSTFGEMIKFLGENYSEGYYFKTVQGNLNLDYMMTQENLCAKFLNGKSVYLKPIRKVPVTSASKINLKNFDIVKPIGSGGFSKVYLCRFKEDGKFYALKMIDKDMIVKHKKKKIIMN